VQPIYARLIAKGTPEPGQERPSSNGLDLGVSYFGLKGDVMTPSSIAQGTDFMAEITVRNSGGRAYQALALAALFPSGWEIHNMRLDGPEGVKSSAFDYLDIRDDRVYVFFDLKQGETKQFRILLNASYLGKYYLPMQSVEAMYDASIQARLAGQWVTVDK
jgi:uncharacterized protein YfaS (alpha-2-macroglobulin family)